MLRDRRGQLWVGSAAGLFRRAATGGPLQAVPLAPGRAVQPQALAQDSAGRIWAGSLHEGVFVLGDDGDAPAVDVREAGVVGKPDVLGNSQITSLLEVQPGEMWVATLGQGVVSIDVEHVKKGKGSSPFDDEGVITRARSVVENGVLQGYFLSSYSARKLGMRT